MQPIKGSAHYHISIRLHRLGIVFPHGFISLFHHFLYLWPQNNRRKAGSADVAASGITLKAPSHQRHLPWVLYGEICQDDLRGLRKHLRRRERVEVHVLLGMDVSEEQADVQVSTDVRSIAVQARYEAREIHRLGDEDGARLEARSQVKARVEMNVEGALHQF